VRKRLYAFRSAARIRIRRLLRALQSEQRNDRVQRLHRTGLGDVEQAMRLFSPMGWGTWFCSCERKGPPATS
jgi:hypothetical protein